MEYAGFLGRSSSSSSEAKKPDAFAVDVAEPTRTYFLGQVIAGSVHLSLPKPMKATDLVVELVGEARFKPVLLGASQSFFRSRAGHNHEIATAGTAPLWTDRGGSARMAAGERLFEFKINTALLRGMPSSFIGAYGDIRWFLRATIHKSKHKDDADDLRAELPLTMIAFVDVDGPQLAKPVASSNVTRVGADGSSGTVAAVVSLKHGAFIPGDSASVAVRIHNDSTKQVEGAAVSLVQRTTYCVHEMGRSDNKVLAKQRVLDHSLATGHHAIRELVFPIPASSPTIEYERMCVRYFFLLEVYGPGGARIAEVNAPFAVGTYRKQRPVQEFDHSEPVNVERTSAEFVPSHKRALSWSGKSFVPGHLADCEKLVVDDDGDFDPRAGETGSRATAPAPEPPPQQQQQQQGAAAADSTLLLLFPELGDNAVKV
eukprot:m51a1_g11087 putative arrestin domain-containing protein 3-like (429) ;mRNA; f:9392-11123